MGISPDDQYYGVLYCEIIRVASGYYKLHDRGCCRTVCLCRSQSTICKNSEKEIRGCCVEGQDSEKAGRTCERVGNRQAVRSKLESVRYYCASVPHAHCYWPQAPYCLSSGAGFTGVVKLRYFLYFATSGAMGAPRKSLLSQGQSRKVVGLGYFRGVATSSVDAGGRMSTHRIRRDAFRLLPLIRLLWP